MYNYTTKTYQNYPDNLQPHSAIRLSVGLNSFPANSVPSETAFHRFNPTNLFTLRSILGFIRFPIAGRLGVIGLNGGGLDLESVQSRKKRKVGRATGPQVGEKVNTQPMLDDGGEGSCGWDTILMYSKYSFPL